MGCRVLTTAIQGSLALLYISPEFLIKSKRMQTAISKASHSNRIARIAIDEARKSRAVALHSTLLRRLSVRLLLPVGT